jgi:hypothetical protein
MWKGKELAGWWDISWDIIPFGYLLSRGFLVPFWEIAQNSGQSPFLPR